MGHGAVLQYTVYCWRWRDS